MDVAALGGIAKRRVAHVPNFLPDDEMNIEIRDVMQALGSCTRAGSKRPRASATCSERSHGSACRRHCGSPGAERWRMQFGRRRREIPGSPIWEFSRARSSTKSSRPGRAVVLPSLYEDNGPLIILEAQARAKAMIVTDRGGPPEFVRHEETGLIVDPVRIRELAAAMERLAGDTGAGDADLVRGARQPFAARPFGDAPLRASDQGLRRRTIWRSREHQQHPAARGWVELSARLRVAMIGLRGIPATYGGVERAVEELAAQSRRAGPRCDGVCPHCLFGARARASSETCRSRACRRSTPSIWRPRRTRSWRFSMRWSGGRFDVIHLHATGPGAMAPVARLAGVPVVVTIQGLDWRREKWGRGARTRAPARLADWPPRAPIARSWCRGSSSATTATSLARRRATSRTGSKPEQPPAARAMLDLEADSYVLFLGRLVPEKHVHTLIRAYRRVEGSTPLVVAGPGTHSPDYVAEVAASPTQDDRVRVLGPQYGREKAWLAPQCSSIRPAFEHRGPADCPAGGS